MRKKEKQKGWKMAREAVALIKCPSSGESVIIACNNGQADKRQEYCDNNTGATMCTAV